MTSRTKLILTSALVIIGLFFTLSASYEAGAVQYTYDEFNRLKTVTDGGRIITYTYDGAGNRLETAQQVSAIPPTTAATPPGGAYNAAQWVTLTCLDGSGAGCDRTYYTTDGATPTTASAVYSVAISISATTSLKYFSVDRIGNTEMVKTQAYTIDTVPPVTVASPTGGLYSTTLSVTLTCTDSSGMGCDKIYYTTNGTTPTTSSALYSSPINISTTTTLKFFARDLAGNNESVKTQTYTLDTTLPTGTITINTGALCTTNASVTLTLSCSDANGCSQMQFSNDNTTYSAAEAYTTTKAWVLAAVGDGNKTVSVKYKDAAGNWSIAYSDTITFDTTPPTTTATPPGGPYNGARSVTLTCNDGTGTGCDKIYYTTNGTTPTTGSSVYSSAIYIAPPRTLKFFAKDKAGKVESVKTQTYTLDTTLPTGTIAINTGALYTTSASVTLTLTCSDANGCSQMQFSNDNTTYSSAETYGTTRTWGLVTGNGIKTVYVKYRDAAGNWSIVYSDTIQLDITLPVTTASPAGGTYTGARSVQLTCNDTGSGCDKIYYTRNGTTPTTSSSVYSSPMGISTTTTLKFFARDKAGNSETVKSQTYTIQ